jgi:glucan biosynthesis protein C
MNSADPLQSMASTRLDYLDATRAFALVLGVVFHASLSFMPVFFGWAVQDVSTSTLVAQFFTVSHSFRMEVFFLLAGFFSHLTFHKGGARDFARSRAVRVVVPFVVGWFLLKPLIVSGWTMGFASMRGDYEFWPAIAVAFADLKTLPAGLFTQTHLWFLYYLAMITALTLALRAIVVSVVGRREDPFMRRVDSCVAWLSRSPWALPALAVLTAFALLQMNGWGVDTPDRSLKPSVPVLIVYGGFFCFGWLLDRQPAAMAGVALLAPSRWIGAAVGLVTVLLLIGIQMDPGHPHFVAAHRAFVAGYALMMWSLVFLTIGVFQKLCRRTRAWVRYLADSSYWMYLTHLPVVVWLQVAVAEVPVHWSLKLPFVSAITIAFALLSYDVVVRSTFLGAILNGRRRNRALLPWVLGKLGWKSPLKLAPIPKDCA